METSETAWRADRRRFLTKTAIGAGGLTIGQAVLPIRGLLAAASGQESTTTTAVAALTDADIAGFAESVELAIVESYKAAISSGKLTQSMVDVGSSFAAHHTDHARAFAAKKTTAVAGKPNPRLLDAVAGQIQDAPDQPALLRIAFDLETAATSTYLFAIGALIDKAALQLAASILPVESQHAVVLGQAIGRPPGDYLPDFQTKDGALDPAKFPVAK
jgi:hypothetical protein